MGTLLKALSSIPHLNVDEAKTALQAAVTEVEALKAAKSKSSANFKKQRSEASAYATSARVGQVTITAGNFSALIALYKNTADQGNSNRYADPVLALILASLGISGALLILQVLLAHVAPGKRSEAGAYWQFLIAYHHRLLQLIYVLCCCFGSRPHDMEDESGTGTAGRGGYQPVSNPAYEAPGASAAAWDPARTPVQLSTLNKVHPTALGAPGDSISAEPTPTGAPEPIPATSQQIDIVVSAAADGGKLASPRLTGNEPAVKETELDPEEKAVFSAWQQDMNTTITLLGTLLTVLNALIAGLSGPDQPSATAIATAVAAAVANSPAG